MRTEDGSYVGGEANSFILYTPDNHVIYFTGDTALQQARYRSDVHGR